MSIIDLSYLISIAFILIAWKQSRSTSSFFIMAFLIASCATSIHAGESLFFLIFIILISAIIAFYLLKNPIFHSLQWIFYSYILLGSVGFFFAYSTLIDLLMQPISFMQQLQSAELLLSLFLSLVAIFTALCTQVQLKPINSKYKLQLLMLLVMPLILLCFISANSIYTQLLWIFTLVPTSWVFSRYFAHHLNQESSLLSHILQAYLCFALSLQAAALNHLAFLTLGIFMGTIALIHAYRECKIKHQCLIRYLIGLTQIHQIFTQAKEVTKALLYSKRIVIITGYGIAHSHAQHALYDLAHTLRAKGKDIEFVCSPLAGKFPYHIHYLLQQAGISSKYIHETFIFKPTDTLLIIGAKSTLKHFNITPIQNIIHIKRVHSQEIMQAKILLGEIKDQLIAITKAL